MADKNLFDRYLLALRKSSIDEKTEHQAGVSLRGRAIASENDVPDKELEEHIASWPMRVPKAARAKSGVPKAARRSPGCVKGEERARGKAQNR
jgi:hypothetical protein